MSGRLLKILISSILILLFATSNLPAKTGKLKPEVVENSPTVSFNFKTSVNGTGQQVKFLLQNLPLTCTIIRKLKLENFTTRQIEPGYFKANDGAGLEGYIYFHTLSDSYFQATGSGTYSTSKLPFLLGGRASAKITWDQTSPDTTHIRAKINIRVSSDLLHYTGLFLSPIISRITRSKANNIKNVAQNLFNRLNNHHDKIKNILPPADRKKFNHWPEILNP
ncbi:MAG: hypothetical protein ACQEP7_04275 [bacterium]